MDIKTNHTLVSKTARYVTYGELSEKTKYFWFCLHGSQMQCEQVVYKFKDFDPSKHFIVAPEALNRNYLKGFGGDVVASWMTSRDRLHEIKDFSDYLTQLYKKHLDQIPQGCKRIIFGFSQGATTAYRWVHNTKVDTDWLFVYSGWIPEDISLRESATYLSDIKLLYTYGLQDQFLNEDRLQQINEVIAKNKLDHMIMESHEGIHRIDKIQLKRLFHKHIASKNSE